MMYNANVNDKIQQQIIKIMTKAYVKYQTSVTRQKITFVF